MFKHIANDLIGRGSELNTGKMIWKNHFTLYMFTRQAYSWLTGIQHKGYIRSISSFQLWNFIISRKLHNIITLTLPGPFFLLFYFPFHYTSIWTMVIQFSFRVHQNIIFEKKVQYHFVIYIYDIIQTIAQHRKLYNPCTSTPRSHSCQLYLSTPFSIRSLPFQSWISTSLHG